jgi:two-component system C4-dicarboxylate transport sensor histidine kinase DctB
MQTQEGPPLMSISAPVDDKRYRLEQAGQLLACVQKVAGHDLPNRLVAIQGLLELLLIEEADRLSPEGHQLVQRVQVATRRAHALTQALEQLCRSWTEQPAETLSLYEMARETGARINQLYSDRVIEYDWPEPAFQLTVPRRGLELVLFHLVRNAVQAVREDQVVRIAIGARQTSSGAEFWVADNGRGLTPEQAQQLTALFTGQASTGLGDGLGLVLVRQIAASWGGRIRVETESAGSRFTVALERGSRSRGSGT